MKEYIDIQKHKDYEEWIIKIENHRQVINDFIKIKWDYKVFSTNIDWENVHTIVPLWEFEVSYTNDKYTSPVVIFWKSRIPK